MNKNKPDTLREEFMGVLMMKCGNLETINGYLEDGDVEPLWNWIQENFVPREESLENAVKELNNFANK